MCVRAASPAIISNNLERRSREAHGGSSTADRMATPGVGGWVNGEVESGPGGSANLAADVTVDAEVHRGTGSNYSGILMIPGIKRKMGEQMWDSLLRRFTGKPVFSRGAVGVLVYGVFWKLVLRLRWLVVERMFETCVGNYLRK